jgi:ABC-2 type transport system permease protein
LKKQIQTFMRYRFLLEDLISRDLKVKYRRSVLGLVWSILNPLLMMLVVTTVFNTVLRIKIDNFPLYYLTGSLIFNFISEATSSALVSIISSAPLIKKVYVPKYIFPVEKTLFSFVNMLFSLIAVIIIMLIYGNQWHWTLLLFPVPLVYALIFAIGFGLILASINVFFRDVGHLYSVWLTAWTYLTPIIYTVDMLPGWLKNVMMINPLYHYVTYFRDLVMYGTVPGWGANLTCLAFSFGFLLLGLLVFKKTQDKFILHI